MVDGGRFAMRTKVTIALLLGIGAFAQAPTDAQQEARFDISHAQTVQDFGQIFDVIRAIAGVRVVSKDNANMSLTVRGTAEEIGTAEWLARQLDQPADRVGEGAAEYKLTSVNPGRPLVDETVRIVRIRHAATPQDFVALTNVVRTVAQVFRLSTYLAPNAMIIRGTPDDLRLPESLIHELDQPASQPSPAKSEYRGGPDDLTCVYRLTNAKSAGDVQEVVSALGPPGARVFGYTAYAYSEGRAIIVRSRAIQPQHLSVADRIAMMDWLVKQLDQPPARTPQVSEDYKVPMDFYPANRRPSDEFLRVYRFTAREPMWQFRKDTEQAFGKGRGLVTTVDAPRTVVVYGSAEELAKAAQVSQQSGQ